MLYIPTNTEILVRFIKELNGFLYSLKNINFTILYNNNDIRLYSLKNKNPSKNKNF